MNQRRDSDIEQAHGGVGFDARNGRATGEIENRPFELRFTAPQTPGVYLLQIDMVDELVHWFSDLGFPGLIHELTVVEPTADAG